MKHFLFWLLLIPVMGMAQTSVWTDISPAELSTLKATTPEIAKFRSLILDMSALKTSLTNTVDEDLPSAFIIGQEIILPLPDGSNHRFKVARSKVFPEALYDQY